MYMKKILVTGALGFVGYHLSLALLKKGYQVWGLDIVDPIRADALMSHENFHLVVESIVNKEVVQSLINRVDMVCHLAAVVDPGQCVTSPHNVINVTLTCAIDIVEMLRYSGKPVFFTSTSEIYGKNPKVPWKEDDDRVIGSTDINRWCYTTSKSAVEHLIKASHFHRELDYIIVRLFNIYGPRMKGRVVNRFVDSALFGDDIMVHGDGQQQRCYTYIDDCIDAFVKLIETPSAYNNTYNVGTTKEHTVLELAEVVKEISRSKSAIKFIQHKEVYGKSYEDIPRRVADVSRIEEAIQWKATTSLEKGLASMIDYQRRNPY